MLDPNAIFSAASTLAMLCWLLLAASLFIGAMRLWTWRVTALIVPAFLAVAYVLLIASGFGEAPGGGFGSIAEVRALFASDSALAAGWLHYLAFDLFVGTWIARAGLAAGLHPLLILICLPLTFMFGPAGLLLFILLRLAFARSAAAEVAA